MIVEFVIILITIILVYISLRNEDWRPVALISVVIGILAYFGMDIVVANLESIASWMSRNLEYIISILFIITLTIAAAIWVNRRDDKKKALAEVSKRNKAIKDIEIAGYLEKNSYSKVSEWDEYITVLAQRLSKTRLDGESFALGIAGNWGSGKTTFLRQLKSELEKTFVVLEFDPWICTNSKIVVTGDVTQIDLPDGKRSGLVEASKILKDIDDVKTIRFSDKDVVRHRLVQDIIKAYEKYNNEGKKKQ